LNYYQTLAGQPSQLARLATPGNPGNPGNPIPSKNIIGKKKKIFIIIIIETLHDIYH